MHGDGTLILIFAEGKGTLKREEFLMMQEFMRRAIALAMENVRTGAGGPFAAVIVKDGRVVAEGVNRVTATNDPTAHAEVPMPPQSDLTTRLSTKNWTASTLSGECQCNNSCARNRWLFSPYGSSRKRKLPTKRTCNPGTPLSRLADHRALLRKRGGRWTPARQVFLVFAGGARATADSPVSRRKVKVSCRYRRTEVSVWLR